MNDDLENPYESNYEQPQDTWLTSYGDLVTILLVFFVLLISTSRISAIKFEKIKNAFEGNTASEFSIATIHDLIVKKIEDNNLQDYAEVIDDGDTIAVVLKEALLFDTGSADLKEENRHVLELIIVSLRDLPEYARIAIEGYTDDNPMNSAKIRSNWHLSAMRALTVLEEFEALQMCQKNCELRGFGQLKPVRPNRDEQGQPIAENQSYNRRVIIRIY